MTSDTARDSIELAAHGARVEIAPMAGGALAAFTLGGTAVLRPTSDEARTERNVRNHACYPLIPYSNRIANARLSLPSGNHALQRNLGDHPHSIHGVGWQRPWNVDARSTEHALLSLVYSPRAQGDDVANGPVAWPWAFHAMQSFALSSAGDEATLALRLTIENADRAAFPFGLGWHPFFPRTANTELGLHAEGVWETDDTQLPTRHSAIPSDWLFDPPHRIESRTIDNVFTDWTGRATLTDRERGIAVAVEADRACRFLVVYIPPERDYLAIEPVTHMTDAFNRAARGARDTGTRMLPPGHAFSTTMRVSARLT